MPRKIITEELKQEIIKYYLSQPMTMKQIEDKYELSHPTMTKILKDVPKYTKDGHNRFLHSISFCGTHKLMEDISNYSFEYLNLKQKPLVYDYKDRQLSELKIQNIEDMKTFGDWIYNSSTIYLNRKKDIYDNFLQHYNLKIKNMTIPR